MTGPRGNESRHVDRLSLGPFPKIALAVASMLSGIVLAVIVLYQEVDYPVLKAGACFFSCTVAYVMFGYGSADAAESRYYWAFRQQKLLFMLRAAGQEPRYGASLKELKAEVDALPAEARKVKCVWPQDVRILVAAGWPLTMWLGLLVFPAWGLIDRAFDLIFTPD